MLGLEVSKYRIHYGDLPCPRDKSSDVYIAQRSLFLEDVYDVLYEAESTLAFYGEKLYEDRNFGYEGYDENKHLKLQLLHDSLERHRNQLMWSQLDVEPCLSEKNVQKTIEDIKGLIVQNCCQRCKDTLVIDKSKEEDWIDNNPYCVAREKWEELAYKVCNDLKFKITVKEVACDIAFTVTSKEVDCTLQYAIESNKKDCKINFDVSEKDWNKNVKNTSYSDGKKLSKCGVSFNHIIGLEKCNIKTGYSEANRCPVITYKNKTISLGDINIDTAFDSNNNCTLLEQIKL